MPDWAPELRARLALLRLAPTREAAIVEELSQHLDDRRQELIAGGLDPDEATRVTVVELERASMLAPQLAQLRQAHAREPAQPGVPRRQPLSGLWQDLRCALRTLRQQPAVTLVAVLTLALGIGLNTSMFSFLNALLLRPLPFPDAAQLVRVFRTTPQDQYGGFSPADYLALDRDEAGFGRVAAYQASTLTLPEPRRSSEWYLVTTDFFDLLGLPPERGRFFRPDEAVDGSHVVVISHAFWQNQFGGASDVIGRTIEGSGEPYEIVGVLPASAGDQRLFGQVGLFSPLTFSEAARRDRTTHQIGILGRRNASVSEARGNAFIAAAGARAAADFPDENARTTWRIDGLPESGTSPTGRAILFMLLGLSGFVLLIACSNLANLLLARAIERTREFAVRAALGASRPQLIRTLALEALVLAVVGGAGALAVAVWTTGWLASFVMNAGGPALDFALDWRVLTFASSASASTLLVCGIVPAAFMSRVDAHDALKSGGRGATIGRRDKRVRHVLIACQFALAMTLLAGAGFFLRGTANLLAQDHGWSADRVLLAELRLPESTYANDGQITTFHRQLVDRLERLPGVQSASLSYGLPYLGLRGDGQFVGDRNDLRQGSRGLSAKINGVTPSYFEVTGTRLLAGRTFGSADTAASPRVVIISESMSRALFPNGSPIGRAVAEAGQQAPTWMEVVGVVSDVSSIDVAEAPIRFQLYQPTAQDPRRDCVIAVRTTGIGSGAGIRSMRATIASLDPGLTVRGLMPATVRMEEVTTQMALVQHLLIAFAVLGVFLAALGIYGAMTRMVARRTEEVGIRMALGAQRLNVIRLVLGAGLRVVLLGAAVGLAGAVALSRLLGAVLPSMQTNGSLVAGAATGILVGVALLACYLPARRATRIDPMMALRSE